MLRNLLTFIIFSIIILLLLPQWHELLHAIGSLQMELAAKLDKFFPDDHSGWLISQLLSLIIVPAFIALIPTFICWLWFRREMPYFSTILWTVWVIVITLIGIR